MLSQFTISVYAQNDMLIEQLSNRLVVRNNFDKNNNLVNKQTFKVGRIKKVNSYLEIDVVTQLFNKKGESIEKYTTIYRCNPDESSIMVMIFPFSNSKTKKTKINSTSKKFNELYNLENLEDAEMEINFDSGLLDFFGSQTRIKIHGRTLQSNGAVNVIKSKVNVNAYAFGIRIKRYNYTVIEKLTLKGVLIFQKFTEKEGSYFTMEYKKQE